VTFKDGVAQLLPQTVRHSAIVKLLGLQHVIVAINKIGLDRLQRKRASTRSAMRTSNFASAWD